MKITYLFPIALSLCFSMCSPKAEDKTASSEGGDRIAQIFKDKNDNDFQYKMDSASAAVVNYKYHIVGDTLYFMEPVHTWRIPIKDIDFSVYKIRHDEYNPKSKVVGLELNVLPEKFIYVDYDPFFKEKFKKDSTEKAPSALLFFEDSVFASQVFAYLKAYPGKKS